MDGNRAGVWRGEERRGEEREREERDNEGKRNSEQNNMSVCRNILFHMGAHMQIKESIQRALTRALGSFLT